MKQITSKERLCHENAYRAAADSREQAYPPPGRLVMLGRKIFTGVEVDTQEIRIAVLSFSRRGVTCRLLYRHPGPDLEAWEEGDVEEVAAVLKAAFQSAPGAGKRVVTALGGQKVVLRQVSLPAMPAKELEQAAVWEAERLLPLPAEELIVRPVVLGERGKGELNVLLVAAPKDLAYRYYHIFRQAGLQIVAIDLQHLALWRVFHGSFGYPVHDGGVRAVLNLGLSSGQFIVVKGQELVYLRSLPVELKSALPGGDFVPSPPTLSIEPALEDEKEAAPTVELKYVNGDLERYQLAESASVADLVREVRRSMDFYQLQERDNPVESLVVTGYSSKVGGLVDFLAGELGLPVESGYPLLSFRDAGKPPQVLDPSFAVAVGLALREVLV